jgi:hypothetical protein
MKTRSDKMEDYIENIGKIVFKMDQKSKKPGKKFKSGSLYNTVKSVIIHPIINVPAYTFEEDESYVECRRCYVAELDESGQPVHIEKGPSQTPRSEHFSPIRVYPVGLGNHNNTYFLAIDRDKQFEFRICCFPDKEEAYILNHRSKIDVSLLDPQKLRDFIQNGIGKWDFLLKTPIQELFLNFTDTEELLTHINPIQ